MTERNEQCEYDPVRHAARYDGEGCENPATLSVGADGKWHICASCAALPEFSRFRARRVLPGAAVTPGEAGK